MGDQPVEPELPKKKERWLKRTFPKFVKFLEEVLDNKLYIAFVLCVTVYALFADNMRILVCPKALDDLFYGITSFAMLVFFVELMLDSLGSEGYLLGFYFWLDLIATLSMVVDIGWIWNEVVGYSDPDTVDSFREASVLARASRGAKLGS